MKAGSAPVESLGVFGTVRYMVFFVIELRSRAVQVAGMRINPDGAWMLESSAQKLSRALCDGWTELKAHFGESCQSEIEGYFLSYSDNLPGVPSE